jgi:hypothetical protein
MAEMRNANTAWPNFQSEDYEIPIDTNVSPIITDVLETYDIPSGNVKSGKLLNVDLKRVPPIEAMKASLLELLALEGTFYELRVNATGKVETYIVGSKTANLDLYYTIKSVGYLPKEVNVMVTGAKPRAKRIVYDFKHIIGGDATYTIWDTTKLTSSCTVPGFSSSVVITYNDPLLTTGKASYRDGIPNMFELTSPFQSIIGWAWNVNIKEETNSYVNIIQRNTASVPVLISEDGAIGIPRRRKYVSLTGDETDCIPFEEDTGSHEGEPVVFEIPLVEGLTYESYRGTLVNKFMGINQLFAVGINLRTCRGIPIPSKAIEGNLEENTVVFVSSNNVDTNILKLSPGIHYIEDYTDSSFIDGDGTIKIQFANNALYNDKGRYGTNVNFYIDYSATDLINLLQPVITSTDLGFVGKGNLLPVNGDGTGLLIYQLWAQIDLDTPCFIISDPMGRADDIAYNLDILISPIVLEEEPPPMALNGRLIDQTEGIKDNDPTTAQNFEDTPLERAQNDMKGRTTSINLASLDEDATINLSAKLYSILKKDSGISYSHTCGPNSKVSVGDKGPNGKIINTITYNYSDSGSYLITAVEGDLSYGNFAGMGGGLYKKQVEDVTATGTIIQQIGDHVYFKVRVDGVGNIVALNGYPGVLDIGDKVNVIIHNNAVEI